MEKMISLQKEILILKLASFLLVEKHVIKEDIFDHKNKQTKNKSRNLKRKAKCRTL